jgi:predicted RNase H-like HicB family nuclease
MKLTAVIEREGDGYVSFCPELDIASQGETIESARDNLREALELFFESASREEVKQRLREEVFITRPARRYDISKNSRNVEVFDCSGKQENEERRKPFGV